MRAVSTVLDVAVFLLLVSVALLTLTVPAAEPPKSTADETAETLAATTGNVTYSSVDTDGDRLDPSRTAAGTHAELLGRAAVADLRLDGTSVTPTTSEFRAAVHEELGTALAWSTERSHVAATWEPYPDAPIRGEVDVGTPPPAGADVATATLMIPSPFGSVNDTAAEAREGGYRGVAREVVRRVLRTTLATDRPADGAVGGLAARDRQRRLRAYAQTLGIDEPDGEWTEATQAIEERLVDRLAADLRERFTSPAAAAAAVRTDRVHVVVREWSA